MQSYFLICALFSLFGGHSWAAESAPFVPTQENLFEKYRPLLEKAHSEAQVDKRTFSNIRLRCDDDVMKWLGEALYSVYEGAPFNPKIPPSGITSITNLANNPEEVIKRFLREDERGGIKDYIKRVKTTFPGGTNEIDYSPAERSRVQNLIAELEAMHTELAKFLK